MKSLSSLAFFLLLAFASTHAAAQTPDAGGGRCEGPVYERKEVARPAKIISRPEPGFTEEARKNGACGTVKLTAVLCRTGRVTNVEVVQSLPHGLTERSVNAIKRVTFTPAEMDGRPVSQRFKVEYNFNIGDCNGRSECMETPGLCAGRLVEAVQVEGNRRMSDDGVLAYIRTRPGDPYSETQAQRDLQALLALPLFDRTATHLTTTTGVRGGVVVIFTLKELPIIRSIVFAGLESATPDEVFKALRESEVGELRESPYDPSKVRRAEAVIKRLLARRGRKFVSVTTRVEEISSMSVEVTFVIEEREWKIIPAR